MLYLQYEQKNKGNSSIKNNRPLGGNFILDSTIYFYAIKILVSLSTGSAGEWMGSWCLICTLCACRIANLDCM